jgi:hypothetical protein
MNTNNTKQDQKDQRRLKNRRQCGASLVEMALLISLMSLAAVPAITNTGVKVGLRLCQGAADIPGTTYYNVQTGVCQRVQTCGIGYYIYINPSGQSTSCLPFNK